MNASTRELLKARSPYEWVACAGMAIALSAVILWTAAGEAVRMWLAAVSFGALALTGVWLEQWWPRWRAYGRILIAGGLAGLPGLIVAAHRHEAVAFLRPWWAAGLAVVAGAGLIAWCSARRTSQLFASLALALALVTCALTSFTPFSLIPGIVLAALGAWFLRRRDWPLTGWITLPGVFLLFLIWWPLDNGQFDGDRYLPLFEFQLTLAAFIAYWLLFVWAGLTASETTLPAGRRAAFLSLTNALTYGAGMLILPPRFPDWFWKFTLAFGVLVAAAAAASSRLPRASRALWIQGGLLITLGLVSAASGQEPAAMLAVASAFLVLTAERREQQMLHQGAFATGLVTVLFAWEPLRRHDSAGMWIGALSGAVLVFNALWIARRRPQWPRGATGFFVALGLVIWFATTWMGVPEIHRAPALAIEALVLTATFLIFGVRELPYLAKAYLLAAQIVWFMQIGSFTRPWWNPTVVVFVTIYISHWWQSRGRTLMPEWERRLVQGVAAAVVVAIALWHLEDQVGAQPMALVLLPILALVSLLLGMGLGDRFFIGFGQLFTATAVGEFIGQLPHSPAPPALAALVPIAGLLVTAPLLRHSLRDTADWARPARLVALLYRALAAALFVVWTIHYLPAGFRFITLACFAFLLLLACVLAKNRTTFLESLVCSTGALIIFWAGAVGQDGFRLVDLAGFVLLLGYGVLGRNSGLLPDIIKEIGILLGLASVTHWVDLWAAHHFPAIPRGVVWAALSLIILAFGWWLRERFYRGFAWALLVAALGCTFYMGMDPAFRRNLLAIGVAALIAALSYYRRSAESES